MCLKYLLTVVYCVLVPLVAGFAIVVYMGVNEMKPFREESLELSIAATVLFGFSVVCCISSTISCFCCDFGCWKEKKKKNSNNKEEEEKKEKKKKKKKKPIKYSRISNQGIRSKRLRTDSNSGSDDEEEEDLDLDLELELHSRK